MQSTSMKSAEVGVVCVLVGGNMSVALGRLCSGGSQEGVGCSRTRVSWQDAAPCPFIFSSE